MAELFRTKGGLEPIEANLVAPETYEAVAIWCGGVSVLEHNALDHAETYAAINVPTSSGMKRASEGDWIIRRPTGDFYPVKPERFSMLFELVIHGN